MLASRAMGAPAAYSLHALLFHSTPQELELQTFARLCSARPCPLPKTLLHGLLLFTIWASLQMPPPLGSLLVSSKEILPAPLGPTALCVPISLITLDCRCWLIHPMGAPPVRNRIILVLALSPLMMPLRGEGRRAFCAHLAQPALAGLVLGKGHR